MNPTARNVASSKDWKGLRAPWIGTKAVWKMFYDLGLISDRSLLETISDLKPEEWNEEFSEELYTHVAEESLYITNISKSTQPDARPISNTIYKKHLPGMYREIDFVKPKKIISFGNQVSSVLLSKSLTVSDYTSREKEELEINNVPYNVFPTYYPVGQGRRNMPIAKKRIQKVLKC
jgi:DNA polymerase